MSTELHTRSWFSFQAGGSSPESLVARASKLGHSSLALTDCHGVYGAARFQKACEKVGIKPIFGAEVDVAREQGRSDGVNRENSLEGEHLVLLAESRAGYSNLCSLLTKAHLRDRNAPVATLCELEEKSGGLFCLTGTHPSRLWTLVDRGKRSAARCWIEDLVAIFGDRLSIEVSNHLLPGDKERMRKLSRLSEETGIPLAATGDVRYAVAEHQARYDLLTCVREGITVFDPHQERPNNAEAYLRSSEAMRKLIPYPDAWERTSAIAEACNVDLLPDRLTTPEAEYESDDPPRAFLRGVCEAALAEKYNRQSRADARRQMKKELSTIEDLQLEEFFLVVREIVQEARSRGIRCAGRGSAANSIVAYLLDITSVDPIEHNLLFERFLHRGRKGTPDIDVDFDSDRRDEVIHWMEERFGMDQTAMTATVVTYRLRSALRESAKALGWPQETINDLTADVPRRNASQVYKYRDHIERRVGKSDLTDSLLEMTASLNECPRHLGLHSGGMLLSRRPLENYTPIQRSANGVRMAQFDKNDVEALGLVKFDALGLRMLASISEADELIERHEGQDLDLNALPLDDTRTFNLIRSGDTVGCFQIESQGQLHLLAKHQPKNFNDLITEIALFRPGPLQGNMVDPYVRRRRGKEPAKYDHPSLKPILKDTYGIILFQEQVLEVVHQFAGMSLERADDFRDLMSDFRDPGEMENMREEFVKGALNTHDVSRKTANDVFDKVSGFVGYGFCRSHAAAFAKTVYQSAYLKAHYPAAFMAAIMQQQPGMYSQMTLEEEARRFGVEIRGPDIRWSGIRYELERAETGGGEDPSGPTHAIRKPLSAVQHVTPEDAREVVWARLEDPFESVEDLYRRVALDIDALESLARSGALDPISSSSRTALWEVGVIHERIGAPGQSTEPTLFETKAVTSEDIPDLPELEPTERLSWDLETHSAARKHPMTLARRSLQDLEIRTVDTCYRFGRAVPIERGAPPPRLTIAGITILRQRPSTANGVTFLTVEDETGFIQCIVYPQVWSTYEHVLTGGHVIVRGKLQIEANWRGLIVEEAWRLNGIFGGYEGHPSASGGRDRLVERAHSQKASSSS